MSKRYYILSFYFILLALAAAIYFIKILPARSAISAALKAQDTLATITAILKADKKDCRLLDHWPEGPRVMLEYSRLYGLDPYLLPAISRVEGPSPTMLKARNIYGLESRGELIEFIDYHYSTALASYILKKYRPRYQPGGPGTPVNIDTLAAIWCPASRARWTSNLKSIYGQAVK